MRDAAEIVLRTWRGATPSALGLQCVSTILAEKLSTRIMVPVRLIIRRCRKRLRKRIACISDCIHDKHEGAGEEHTAPQTGKDEKRTTS